MFLSNIYAAHIRDDGKVQTVLEHLEGTAILAKSFAESFGSGDYAYLCGMLHDIGKYSQEFQKRIRGASKRVDHSGAGAIMVNNELPGLGRLFAYCIAGHHTGLPDGGSKVDTGIEPTLSGRLKRLNLPSYSAFLDDLDIKDFLPQITRPIKMLGENGFTYSFFVRMLFSCLVDADFLDTEAFMSNGEVKRGIDYDIDNLYSKLQDKITKFGNPKSELNKKRNEILNCCIEKALLPKGLFTLTVPTGGGKTISSLAFALRHAKEHGLKRIIYVIPYTSIIEQNAAVFKDMIGAENVLEHHSNFNYDDENESMSKCRLATENWDMPVIVTTNVQFFESMFANRTSKCRKLHSIANSVIIFDEAQMFPTEYLLPCIRAISELAYNYGSTAVLCSATQPALSELFPKELTATEICENTAALYDYFNRTKIVSIGQLEDADIAKKINNERQVLCIVNTKRQAQNLFKLLDAEGSYHLSTLMCPAHRKIILKEIKEKLTSNLPCRVVSTSLIEAGVDVDFPTVFRSMAGLDSQIQAAGRCNRERKREKENSFVYVFDPSDEYKRHQPSAIKLPTEVARSVARQHADVSSPDAIKEYFLQLYGFKGEGLDIKEIVKQMENGAEFGFNFPFAKIASEFRLIDEITNSVFIPFDDKAEKQLQRLKGGERSMQLLRSIQTYTVNIYQRDYDAMYGAGFIEPLDNEIAVLKVAKRYSRETGLDTVVENGIGIFSQ